MWTGEGESNFAENCVDVINGCPHIGYILEVIKDIYWRMLIGSLLNSVTASDIHDLYYWKSRVITSTQHISLMLQHCV